MNLKPSPTSAGPRLLEKRSRLLKTVKIRLTTTSYLVHIGAGVISKVGPLLKSARSRRAFIIADEKLKGPRAQLIAALEKSGWETHEIAVTAGEGFKNFESVLPIFGELLKLKADRDSVLFALGGGSIGDAAGFIASTYLRGIDWVGVPTTLLAQVDSSVGGKTGINHPLGKNLVGTFHQPIAVICDLDFLQTLSQREMVSGLGEIIKYGLIYDAEFLSEIQEQWDEALRLNPRVLARLVGRSLEWKAKAIENDEFDRFGSREALNYGHTFGHALEKATGYAQFQHGEAVLWGMRFATTLSMVRRSLKTSDYKKISEFLSRIELPPLPRKVTFSNYLQHMAKDKKLRQGKVHFVLLKRVGKSFSDGQVTERDLKSAFQLLVEIYGKR